MRTFIALELPTELCNEVTETLQLLAHQCHGHFMPRENLHVTLAFLGEISEPQARETITALDEACTKHAPVLLEPDGLGTFGRASDATLWLGFKRSPELMELAAGIRENLSAHGLAYDEKNFLPHVTLARRVHLPGGTLPELPLLRPAEASHVMLFKSTLSSTGATYKPLYTVELRRR